MSIPLTTPMPRAYIKSLDGMPADLIAVFLAEVNVKKFDPALEAEYGNNPNVILHEGLYLDTYLSDEAIAEGEKRRAHRKEMQERKEKGLKHGQ